MPTDEMVEKVKNAIRDAVGCHTATGRPGVGCMTMDVPELCSCWVAAKAALSAAHAEPVAARSSFGPGSRLADVMTMGAGRQSHVASPSEAAIRADERAAIRKEAFEEAARIAEATKNYDDNLQRSAGALPCGERIATAIRARGNSNV